MSARVALAAGYFPAYARLPRKAQRKADEFIRKFTTDPTQASIHYEPIRNAVDQQLRSVRIGDDYRAIVRAPEQGTVFVLLWVDHHDEAYRWAESKQLEVHPVTGTLQVFDVDAASRVVTELDGGREAESDEAPEYEEKRLFSDFTDEQLFAGGLPRPLIPAVRALYTHDDLDRLLGLLPQEAADLLTGLAAGYEYDAVLEQILDAAPVAKPHAPPSTPAPPPVAPVIPAAPEPPPVVDPVEVALERESTQREFRLLDESFDLEKALTYPLDVWRVYLHPSQRRVVRARTKGPMRVTGGAGTGKTVVAMHRAAFLVREVYKAPDDRVLVTTFTRNLACDIRDQLEKLLEPEELARIEVTNIDAWANQYVRACGKPMRLAVNKDCEKAWRSALDLYGVDGFDQHYCKAEWECVIQEQNLRDVEAYARAVRRQRGLALSRPDRRRLWEVFEQYRSALEAQGLSEAIDILRAARQELELRAAPPPYRSVVVDETQDLSTEALRLVRAIAGPEHPNDLFLVGDAHQRIYGRPAPLGACGINIRGRRSRELRINYRTTAAICRWAFRMLGTGEFDDLDEGTVRGKGYVSLRTGEKPVVRHFASQAEERAFVVAEIQKLLAEGVPPASICVVSRARNDSIASALAKAAIDHEMLDKERPRSSSVRLATMHRVKGLEFSVMFVVSVNDGTVPWMSEGESDDPLLAEQALLRERCLLYVAASRARDTLYVTSSVKPSPFLHGLDDADVAKTREEARARTIPPAPPPQAAAPDTAAASAPEGSSDPESELDRLLAAPLDSLLLPTRIQNWCDRKKMTAVRELVAVPPLELTKEPNLGRKTIAETRTLIENYLGHTWEELVRLIHGVPTASPAAPASPRTGWDRVRADLSPALAALPVEQVGLPHRMLAYCEREGVRTLGALAQVDRQRLIEAKNLGRGTVSTSAEVILDCIENYEARRAAWSQGLLASWKDWMRDLETIPRMILAPV